MPPARCLKQAVDAAEEAERMLNNHVDHQFRLQKSLDKCTAAVQEAADKLHQCNAAVEKAHQFLAVSMPGDASQPPQLSLQTQ